MVSADLEAGPKVATIFVLRDGILFIGLDAMAGYSNSFIVLWPLLNPDYS